jgi:hypothetical protein
MKSVIFSKPGFTSITCPKIEGNDATTMRSANATEYQNLDVAYWQK